MGSTSVFVCSPVCVVVALFYPCTLGLCRLHFHDLFYCICPSPPAARFLFPVWVLLCAVFCCPSDVSGTIEARISNRFSASLLLKFLKAETHEQKERERKVGTVLCGGWETKVMRGQKVESICEKTQWDECCEKEKNYILNNAQEKIAKQTEKEKKIVFIYFPFARARPRCVLAHFQLLFISPPASTLRHHS